MVASQETFVVLAELQKPNSSDVKIFLAQPQPKTLSGNTFVQFLDVIIWPVVVVFLIILFRRQFSRIVSAIGTRIRDRMTDFEVSTRGIRMATREMENKGIEDTLNAVLKMVDEGDFSRRSNNEGALEKLIEIASDYKEVLKIERLEDRLSEFSSLSWNLGAFVIAQNINRDELAAAADTGKNEGLVLALVSSATALPKKADVGRILRVAGPIRRPMLLFRITSALRRLAQRGMINMQHRSKVLALIDKYETIIKNRDGYTQSNIDAIRDLLAG